MQLLRDMLSPDLYARYQRISKLNIRSSIYDVTNRCNLRCKGCFFFSSGEHKLTEEMDVDAWEAFVMREKDRGVNLAILIGGEPTLYLDRIAAFEKHIPSYVATNGLIRLPRDRFPETMVGISLWGDDQDEKVLRGRNTFEISRKNYAGDPYTYYLYTITPNQVGTGKIESCVRKIQDVGLKVHFQLLSNDEGVGGYHWTPAQLADVRTEMDGLMDAYPRTVISSRYYHRVLTTGTMMGRPWGWMECPSVTIHFDDRQPRPPRLIEFIRWGADLRTQHRCCTSATRDCTTCKDGAAHMSWVMVNKRLHRETAEDLANWVEVYEMFAKLYHYIPW
jgi:hypothetical protein